MQQHMGIKLGRKGLEGRHKQNAMSFEGLFERYRVCGCVMWMGRTFQGGSTAAAKALSPQGRSLVLVVVRWLVVELE